MGGRGSWSNSGEETYNPTPGGFGGGGAENVVGPRIPDTLAEALGSQGKPMSPAEASKGTNPHYNPLYDAYSSNCQRCVLAYEARRRGYDVTALPTYHGDLLPFGGDYLKALSKPKVVSVGKSVRKITSEMKKYGNGARAIIKVWRGRNGHVFIAENHNGNITYIDPQSNSHYAKLSLAGLGGAQVIRVDNLQFTEYAKNAFTRQKV